MAHYPNESMYPAFRLNVFPYFATRETYEKFYLKKCPPYNPNLPIKKWVDETLLKPENQDEFAIVENVLKQYKDGSFVQPFVLSKIAIIRDQFDVNIPSEHDVVTITKEIPVPMKPLDPDEELFMYMGLPQVKNKNLYDKQNAPAAGVYFNADDRAMLIDIQKKLSALYSNILDPQTLVK